MLGGCEVLVPPGDYLTGAVALRSNTTLRLERGATILGTPDFVDYPVTQVRWEGKWIQGHVGLIYAVNARHIAVVGPGRVVGNAALGGRPTPQNPLRRPALIETIGCDDLRLEDFSTEYSRMWSIHPTYTDNIVIRNLTIRSTGGNGDGIDIDSCKHVRIEHCKFTHAQTHAIYIKSRPGRGAFIEDITAKDLDVSGMVGGFLRFNFLNSGLQDQVPVPGLEGILTVRNFRFSNVRVKDVPVLVDGTSIHPDKPLEGFTLENVTGTAAKGISLAYIRGAKLRDIKVTGYTGPLVGVYNVTGSGLKGAAAIPAPQLPEPVPAPARPYQLR